MAERLKTKLLEEEKIVDLVAGPDSYRDLPNLVAEAETGQKAVNVFLSREETYADIAPIRLNTNGVTALVSIMRGCDNMCSFCVVPYTRGRERSREPYSIIKEVEELHKNGYKEQLTWGFASAIVIISLVSRFMLSSTSNEGFKSVNADKAATKTLPSAPAAATKPAPVTAPASTPAPVKK
ncbi:hypothetical protein B566_EDAN019312 [Ephemera danica]|nr:hypothetical protein B566_EDAN019312 [Ephemera danica]